MKSSRIFRENVKKLMNDRGIKVKDLASMVGLSPSYLSLVLSGERENLSDFHKDAIALALGVELWQLFRENATSGETTTTTRVDRFRTEETGVPEAIRALDDFLFLLGVEDLALKAAVYRRLNALSGEELAKLGAVLAGALSDWRKTRTVPAMREGVSEKGTAVCAVTEGQEEMPLALREDLPAVAAAVSLLADIPENLPVEVLVEGLGWPVARVLRGLAWLEARDRVSLMHDPDRGLMFRVSPDVLWHKMRNTVTRSRLKEIAARLGNALKGLGQEGFEKYAGDLYLEAGEIELARPCYRVTWERALEEKLWHRARGFIEMEIALLRILGGPAWEEAYCHDALATCCLQTGDLAEARAAQLKALKMWRSLDRRSETVRALESLATIEARAGRWEAAQSAVEEALTLAGTAEDEARLRCTLGEIALERGTFSEARDQLQRAVDICQSIDWVSGLQRALLGLGVLLSEKGRFEEAGPYLTRVLSLAEAGEPGYAALARTELGNILLMQGKPEQALERFRSARSLAGVVRDPRYTGMIACGEARALVMARRLREIEPVAREVEEALEAFTISRWPRGMVFCLIAKAEIESALGHPTRAAQLFDRAVRTAQEHGSRSLEALACQSYASFMRRQHDPLYRVMEERANWIRTGLS